MINCFKKNKKAQNTFLIIALFGFLIAGAIFLLVVMGTNFVLLKQVDVLVQDEDDFSAAAKASSTSSLEGQRSGWDNAFLLLVGGLLVALFIAGATIQNSPVVVVVVLLLLIFAAYAGFHVNNLYEELSSDTVDDIDFQTNFPKSHLIMSNIVVVLVGAASLFGLGIFLSERFGI